MTPEQKRLARHALGLPNLGRESYRNRYIENPNHPEWLQMIQRGEAVKHKMNKHSAYFQLTRKGAELALEKGESLCLEDFQED